MLFGVAGHLLHLFGEFDERFVLDARAARAADDVERVEAVSRRPTANAAGGDVVENLPAGGDFLRLAIVRHGERHADRVADAAADELLERDPRLDDAVGRQAGFGHAQMQRHIRPRFGEAAVDFDHLRADRNP